MPIINTVNLYATKGSTNSGFLTVRSRALVTTGSFLLNDPEVFDDYIFSQFKERIDLTANLTLFENPKADLAFLQKNPTQIVDLNLRLFEGTQVSDLSFLQINDTQVLEIPFLLVENYQKIMLRADSIQESVFTVYDTTIGVTFTGGQLLNLFLDQVDVRGPDILNIIPLSGSSFNNPQTNVSFDIRDSEGSNVVSGSFSVAVNNLLLVSGGVTVCPPGSGSVTYSRITNSLYQFVFNPSSNFLQQNNPVVVSGRVQDDETIANVTNFTYDFNVWHIDGLAAMISGSPDIQSPYLKNLNPSIAQTQILPSANINLSITDDHTGLEPSSVTILVNSIPAVLSGTAVNTDYVTSISNIDSGNGRQYIINPVNNFSYNSAVTVQVSGSDRFSIAPNYLNQTYTFFTQSNTHLLASGLQLNINGTYTDLNILNSLPISTTGTDFRITYLNLLGLGVNPSGSYVSCNGQTISGASFVPVSGNNIYDVYFSMTPDFLTDCDLQFHLEQTTLISGAIVFNDYTTELLWGAQYCFDSDTNFTYSTDISVITQACDTAFNPTQSSLSYRFLTNQSPSNNLSAEIIGLEDIHQNLISNIISNNPFFEYGKTMTLNIEAEDFAGNKLEYTWSFIIEQKP